jgi:hypothetical protein
MQHLRQGAISQKRPLPGSMIDRGKVNSGVSGNDGRGLLRPADDFSLKNDRILPPNGSG